MDDLKDADMLMDYADAVARKGDSATASALYSRAKTRLNQMNECKRTIENVMMRAEQEGAMNGEPVYTDGIYAELYNNWISSWEEKLRNRSM